MDMVTIRDLSTTDGGHGRLRTPRVRRMEKEEKKDKCSRGVVEEDDPHSGGILAFSMDLDTMVHQDPMASLAGDEADSEDVAGDVDVVEDVAVETPTQIRQREIKLNQLEKKDSK